jgi:hypothetical protein
MTDIVFTYDSKATAHMDAFARGETVEDLLFIEGKTASNKPMRFTLDLELLGDLVVSDYGHSVLCKFVNGSDVGVFEAIEEAAASTLNEKIDYKAFIKDDKFFMKFPHKNDKYRATMDPTATPSQPEKSPFQPGSSMVAEFTVSMWINFANAASGLFLNVLKVTVDGGKKKLVRRR